MHSAINRKVLITRKQEKSLEELTTTSAAPDLITLLAPLSACVPEVRSQVHREGEKETQKLERGKNIF
jgi:hypothetical protein